MKKPSTSLFSYRQALNTHAQAIYQSLGKLTANAPILKAKQQKFGLEYAAKLTDKKADEYYVKALWEYCLFRNIAGLSKWDIPTDSLIDLYFLEALEEILKQTHLRKQLEEIAVYYRTAFPKELNLTDIAICCEATFAPSVYPKHFFYKDPLSKSEIKLLHALVDTYSLDCTYTFAPFNNQPHTINFVEKIAEAAVEIVIHFISFTQYLQSLLVTKGSTHCLWLNPLLESPLALPPQMDIFSASSALQTANTFSSQEATLIFSDLRTIKPAMHRYSTPALQKRLQQTYLENPLNTSPLSDAYLKLFRWSTDRLKKKGSLLFLLEEKVIRAETYNGLRNSLQGEFNEIRLIHIKEKSDAYFILLLLGKS